MHVTSWFQDLADVAPTGIDDSSSLVVLRRNTEVPLDSADAWIVAPIISIERDADDVDLITGDSSDEGMTVGDLRRWFDRHPDCAQCELFVPERWQDVDDDWSVRRDFPVIGPVVNAEESAFGVMVWYEGCDDELS